MCISVAGALNILPDTISRLHEKGKIHYLIQLLSHWHDNTIPLPHLQDHMFIKLKPSKFRLPGADNLSEQLDQDVDRYRGAAFSDNTKKTHQTQLSSPNQREAKFFQDNGLCVVGRLHGDVFWTVAEIKPLWYRQWRVSPRQTANSGLLSCLGRPAL